MLILTVVEQYFPAYDKKIISQKDEDQRLNPTRISIILEFA